ncbi:recombination mediator RecR [Patescibacteria group bacterium]|nr:recombination mediator RecR [Patescibacteria group bacterium]MCL5970143.1 recombination mediator RecR [Patescibacteria group bacterium]
MRIPRAIQNLIESFERLPGVGPKTAQRLTFYLLHVPQGELDKFANSLQSLKKDTVLCSTCFTIGETNPCEICVSENRDHSTICVVEQALDVLALEKNGKYNGVYHVLHGKIDPLNNIGPDEIYINQLIKRIKDASNGSSIKEIILATNPTMEGEATAMYISRQVKNLVSIGGSGQNLKVKISRIGRGLPIGADLEYADEVTLQRAMEGRSEY